MFAAVCEYVEHLVSVIRPRRVLYLGIDGVAPRAKMNQQRSRRFKTAKEIEEHQAIKERVRQHALSMGKSVPPASKARFDHNVITPGTPFMDRLAEYLNIFVMHKQNTCAAWRALTVILSAADAPGEGEHKIMDFIRRERQAEGYDPNTRHVLHGLDADLIMLGLATHEVHFTILREEVLTPREAKRKASRGQTVDDGAHKPLFMLHIATLREYLDAEFASVASRLPFPYDLERVIDDFVFLCFFVGNDFLPHLPSLDIREGAVDLLINLYKQVLPSLGGYLTHEGDVNLALVDVLLQRLGLLEDTIFRQRKSSEDRSARWREARDRELKAKEAAAAAEVQAAAGAGASTTGASSNQSAAAALRAGLRGTKRGRPKGESSSQAAPARPAKAERGADAEDVGAAGPAVDGEVRASPLPSPTSDDGDTPLPTPKVLTAEERTQAHEEFSEAVKQEIKQASIDESVVDEVRLGEVGWKDRYYMSKLGPERGSSPTARRELVKEYVTGLQWVFAYYYKGVPSWKWYYPEHYAPFASDLVDVAQFKASFTLGSPFTPLQQLMGVLPPYSAHALPPACAALMKDPKSSVAKYYPTDFAMDPNGKKMTWQWLVLLPFIKESELVKALDSVSDTFTEEEKRRNTLGNDMIFVHSQTVLGKLLQPLLPADQGGAGKKLVRWTPTQVDAGGRAVAGAAMAKAGASGTVGLGQPVQTTVTQRFPRISSNAVLRLMFLNPPHKRHICRLLEGAVPAPRTLHSLDLQIRTPRLNRGMNIAELAFGGGGGGGGRGGGRGFGRGRGRGGLLGTMPGRGPRGGSALATMGVAMHQRGGHEASHHRFNAHTGYADDRFVRGPGGHFTPVQHQPQGGHHGGGGYQRRYVGGPQQAMPRPQHPWPQGMPRPQHTVFPRGAGPPAPMPRGPAGHTGGGYTRRAYGR